jgi:nucleotide-binding universal stress UspA family protein
MSILVATDFSPCSQAAVRLGTALARRRAVPLFLVHTVEHPPIDVPAVPIGPTGWETTVLMAAEVAIAREASEIRRGGVAVETRVTVGSAASTILELAAEQRAELIVLGTHGRRGGARLFLGSVAESVVRSSPCPVLVTRDGPADVERWEGRAPLRLTIAIDGTAASRAAISWVGSFARNRACALTLVRAYFPPEEAMRYGTGNAWGGSRHDPELLPLLRRDLERDARALLGDVPVELRFRAASSEASDALAEEALVGGTDALVIGVARRRPARWAAIVPAAVLRSSAVPVLCVPETAALPSRQIPEVRSVLIATDLSDTANAAIPSGYALLRASGGRVELCTVNVVNPIDALADAPATAPLTDAQRATLETQIRALVPPDADGLGITTGVSVVEGRTAVEAILAAAERLDTDVIAIGSHGRSGVKRALLGSVAEDVARQSPRPVLIVRARPPGAPN